MSNSRPPQTHTVTRLSPGCLAAPLLVLGRWMEIHYVSLVEPLLFIAWWVWARSTPLCPSQDAGGLGCWWSILVSGGYSQRSAMLASGGNNAMQGYWNASPLILPSYSTPQIFLRSKITLPRRHFDPGCGSAFLTENIEIVYVLHNWDKVCCMGLAFWWLNFLSLTSIFPTNLLILVHWWTLLVKHTLEVWTTSWSTAWKSQSCTNME